MTCGNLIQNKIILFSNRGYLDAYYRANLNIAFAVEASLYSIAQMQQDVPFSNNMLFTDSNDTNTVVSNTSIYDFTQNMQTATETFISEVTNIISENREARNASNYSETLNVEFFTTFETVQTKFFKNLANYISMYLFFQDQLAMPSFYPVYDVVDSNLDFSTFVLSDKDHLLKTNIRNMRVQDFRKYRKVFKTLKDQFLNSSLTNESLITGLIGNEDSFQGVVTKLKTFLRFSETMVDKLNDYIIELDTYESILREDKFLSSLDYSHLTLESKLRGIVSNIAASDVVTSISIVEGGEDFQVGDILTVESPDTNEADSILEVTGIINGHIREVGISFSGQGFAVDDIVLDSAGGTTFDMIVNAIQNGFVTSASVEDGGSGFVIGDDMTTTLTQGISTDNASYTTFFESLRDNIFTRFANTTIGGNNETNIRNWVRQTNIYQEHGSDELSGNNSVNFGDIGEGGINNFIRNCFDEFPVSSGLQNVLILMLVQMADYAGTNSDGVFIMNILQGGVNPFTGNVEHNITDEQISSIESSYATDPQSIIQSSNGTGIEITVTDISGELDDSPSLNFSNTGDYSLTYNGKPTDFTTTKDSVTIEGTLSNATVEITSIDPESLSGFQMSHNHLLDHNATPTFDIDHPAINFSYAATTFDSEIDQFHYRKDQLQIANNTKLDSEINDVFHIHSDNRKDLSFKVKNIFCDSNTVELEIDSTDTNKFQVLETFSPTIDSVHNISTQITQVDIDANGINLTSDAPNYDVSYIGNSYPGLVYGSDTNNTITADITSVSFDSNAIELEVADSNDSNFAITDSFDDITYGNSVETISIQPTSVEIAQDLLSSVIQIDTNNTDYEAQQSFSMTYGSDSNNPITVNIDEIEIPENSIQVSTADDSNLLLDQYTVHYSDTNVDIVLTPSQYKISSNSIPIEFDSNDTNFEIDQSLNFSFTNNTITTTVDQITVDPAYIETNFSFNDTNNEAYTVNQSFDISLDGNALNPSVTSVQITENSIDANEIAFTSGGDESLGQTFDMSYGLVDTNVQNITVTVDEVSIAQNTIDSSNIGFTSGGDEILGQSFVMSYGVVDTNDTNVTATVTELSIPENTMDSNNIGFTSGGDEILGQSFDMSYGLVDTNVQNITATVDEVSIPENSIALSYDSNNFVFDSNVSLTQNNSLSIIDTNAIANFHSTNHFLEVSDDQLHAIYVTSYNEENFIYVYNSGTWTLALTPSGDDGVTSVSISSSGQYMYFTVSDYYGSNLYKSSNYGSSFSIVGSATTSGPISIDFSDDAQYGLAGHTNADDEHWSCLRLTTNSGSSWSDVFLSNIVNDNNVSYLNVISVSVSSTGQYMSVLTGNAGLGDASYKNRIYTSSDYGSTWTKHDIAKNWKEIKISSDGKYQTAITSNDKIYVSGNFGGSFSERNIVKNWKSLAMSSSGEIQVASSTTGTYVSYDSGLTWQLLSASEVYDDVSFSSTSLQAIQSSGGDAYEIISESSNSETYNLSYGLVDTNSNNITVIVSKDNNGIVTVSLTNDSITAVNNILTDSSGYFSLASTPTGTASAMSFSNVAISSVTNVLTDSSGKFSLLSTPTGTASVLSFTNDSIAVVNDTLTESTGKFSLLSSPTGSASSISFSNVAISSVTNVLTDSSGKFSLLNTPTGSASVFSFSNTVISVVTNLLTESTGKFSLLSSPTGSASELSFTNLSITAVTDILTDTSGKFSLTTSPVGVVLSVDFAPVSPIQLSDSTLPVTGSDAAKFDFTQETPKGYASSISISHSDIIYNATDSTDFALISSRLPVELSSPGQLGYTVRLSPDGNTLGICDKINNNQFGKVFVYRWDGTTWNLIDEIQQQNQNDMQQTHFGGNIEFSTNGNIMAVAATGPGDRTGMVYVYTLDETDSNNVHYTQLGSTLHDIYETDSNSIFYNNDATNANNVSRVIGFSSDGQYLAVGSPYYDDVHKGIISNVTIYKWNTANSDWEVDQVLNASGRHKRFGFGLALSQDGQKLVSMENDALHYYQKENGSFVEKWYIDSNNYSDFSNIVYDIEGSYNLRDDCKNLIRFAPDGSKFFVGFPTKKKVYIFESAASYDSNSDHIITSSAVYYGFNLDGTSTKLAVAHQSGNAHGAVLYYEYSSENDSWTLTETYTGPRIGSGAYEVDRYGYGISLTDNLLVIGSPRMTNPSIVDIIALVDGSLFDINTILVNDRLGYNYAHNATHVSFLASVDQFHDNGLSSFSLTVKPTGTVSQHTITHNTILATDNTFVDASNNFSLSSTPTGRLISFTQTNPDPLIALDSNGDVSNIRFQVTATPVGTLIIDTTHNVISAVDRSFDDNGNTFIVLDGEQPGTAISFSQSHNPFTIVGTNGGHSQSNHTIVYDADSSPFKLKANHPHGVMTDFSLNFHINDFRIDVANIINDGGIYRFDTFSSEPTDSNSLIDYWQIQFLQKPNGIPTSFDSNISNINLLGPITDSNSVWYTDTNNGPSDQSKHEFILTATGSTVNASQLIEAGDGFSPLTTPLVIANTNGHTTNYPLVTSHTVVNARIADFIINEGGLDYSTNQAVIISKAGATDATLLVDSVRDGMISGITINNGGKDYTLNDTLTLESAGGGNGALIDLTNIDNGHIDTIQIIEEGSGFVAGETLSVIHSRDTNLPNQPTALINSVSSSDNESLLSKIKDLNDTLEN